MSFEITLLVAFHSASWDFPADPLAEAIPFFFFFFLLLHCQISSESLIFLVSLRQELGNS